jgi:hypothetical protein
VNVYPAEVEASLLALPGVIDCAVFGIPDDDLGEVLAAIVQPRPGSKLTPVQISEQLADRLPATSGRATSSCATTCRASRAARSGSACCAPPSGSVPAARSDRRYAGSRAGRQPPITRRRSAILSCVR